MPYPIGIDLGTTNSVACVWRRGKVETIPVDGRGTLPSAISVRPDGTELIGQAAKSRALVEPGVSVTSAKRSIGDEIQWQILGKTYTPVSVSALILGRLKQAAKDYLREEVAEAVITVPAYFNDTQKRNTKLAGEAVGLHVRQLLPEPTAAAISYGLNAGKNQTLLVYDLGGGTFDVSILKVKGNEFDVIAVDGDSRLGGDDFDLRLADHLIGLLQKRTRMDLGPLRALCRQKPGEKPAEVPREMMLAWQRLKEVAESAKKELSESGATQVVIPNILGGSLNEEVALTTYNGLIADLVDRTIKKIGDVLKSARLRASDVDRIILVGGSTRNRLVRERVTQAIKEPWTSARVDEVVAQGAAIVAGYADAPVEDMAPIEFHNVTPFNMGVRATKGKDTDFFEVLLPRNSRVGKDAAAVRRAFTTQKDNQKTVNIAVFQGEGTHCRDNTFIGGFSLTGIPPARAGKPEVVVEFKMDDSDLLAVSATCSQLRGSQQLDINRVSREEDLPVARAQADIMFLVDTSGSMSVELDGVKASGLAFGNRVVEAGVDCRLGLMDFDKPLFGGYKWEVFPPMDPPKFPKAIEGLKIGRLGGMGCYIGDANTVPVIEAFVKAFPANDRLKIGILVSDEVGHDSESVGTILDILKKGGVCLHVFGVPDSCHEELAKETGGKFWPIAESRGEVDFSELLDQVAVEITNLALK